MEEPLTGVRLKEELPWNVRLMAGPALKVGDKVSMAMTLPLNWWQRFLLFWFGIEPKRETVSMTYECVVDLSSSDAERSGSTS